MWDVADSAVVAIPKASENEIPIATITANWKLMYASVPFMVLGEKYCDVLISLEG